MSIRIAFAQNTAVEHPGIMTLAAALKTAGHRVEVFIRTRDDTTLAREVMAFDPHLVGFSVTTGNHHWDVRFAALLKTMRRVVTVFGGPHATFFPEMVQHPAVDIVCRGEGEQAIVELADKIDAGLPFGDTLNCWVKNEGSTEVIKNGLRPLIKDLDSVPYPDRRLYRDKFPFLRRTTSAFMASRGCPYNCSFCFNHAAKALYKGLGQYVRYRSPQRVVDEIVEARASFSVETVYMQDDTLLTNKAWVREFAGCYKERVGLPLLCLVRADQLDEESLVALKEAGLANAFFGIESGDEQLRNLLLKKMVTDEEIYRAAKLLRKHSIRFRTYNMMGLPGETLEQAFKTVAINARIRTDFPWCSLFFPFPGTELGRIAAEQGILEEDPSSFDAPSFFKKSIVKIPEASQIANLQKLFWYGVKFPRLTPLIRRLIRMRPNWVFEVLFLVGYAVSLYGSENLKPGELLSIGFRNLRGFFWTGKGDGDR